MTSEEFTQKAQQIWNIIQNSQNILLHLHPSPDPDSAGSALAMCWALKDLGKNPTVIKGDSDIPNWLKFLPGGDLVVSQNFSEINLSSFDLFIIQDSASKDQITKLVPVEFPAGLKTIVIDHHISNGGYGDINLISSAYPATAAINYELFKQWNVRITPDIAANLFAGIYSDTGGFKYPPVNSATFRTAKELVEIYPDISGLIFNIENNVDEKSLIFTGLALNHIKVYGKNNIAISEVDFETLNSLGIRKKHTQNTDVANMLRSVIGWDLAISFIETEKDKISLSFRTRDFEKIDVSKIASFLGGGGHKAASGATIKKPFVEAKQCLLDAIYSIYPHLKPT